MPQRKTPGSFLPRVYSQTVLVLVGRSRSEVTLNAHIERERTLVAEDVGRSCGSRLDLESGARRAGRSTRHVGVEVGVQNFRAERQVLDRSPTGRETDFGDREAGVTVRESAVKRICDDTRARSDVACAPSRLAGVVIAQLGGTAEQAGRPFRAPVVVERTTDTETLRQLQRGRARSAVVRRTNRVNTVGDGTDSQFTRAAGRAVAKLVEGAAERG
jgi:hypothetical protein